MGRWKKGGRSPAIFAVDARERSWPRRRNRAEGHRERVLEQAVTVSLVIRLRGGSVTEARPCWRRCRTRPLASCSTSPSRSRFRTLRRKTYHQAYRSRPARATRSRLASGAVLRRGQLLPPPGRRPAEIAVTGGALFPTSGQACFGLQRRSAGDRPPRTRPPCRVEIPARLLTCGRRGDRGHPGFDPHPRPVRPSTSSSATTAPLEHRPSAGRPAKKPRGRPVHMMDQPRRPPRLLRRLEPPDPRGESWSGLTAPSSGSAWFSPSAPPSAAPGATPLEAAAWQRSIRRTFLVSARWTQCQQLLLRVFGPPLTLWWTWNECFDLDCTSRFTSFDRFN